MTLDQILHNVADQDRGREFELVDPDTVELTGIKFVVVGPDSATATRARVELYDELAELAEADGKTTATGREKARLHWLAKLVRSWTITEGGEELPCTQQHLLRVLKVLWIQQQVESFAADRAAHRVAV